VYFSILYAGLLPSRDGCAVGLRDLVEDLCHLLHGGRGDPPNLADGVVELLDVEQLGDQRLGAAHAQRGLNRTEVVRCAFGGQAWPGVGTVGHSPGSGSMWTMRRSTFACALLDAIADTTWSNGELSSRPPSAKWVDRGSSPVSR
jgi:hypothetical protein